MTQLKNKLRNKKVKVDGHEFDSRKEAQRYGQLKLLLRAGKISNLQLQVTYELIPAQYDGKRCIERAIKYIADFVYEEDGKTVVEDVKGYKKGATYTVFTIKRKLMLSKYNIRIKEK